MKEEIDFKRNSLFFAVLVFPSYKVPVMEANLTSHISKTYSNFLIQ